MTVWGSLCRVVVVALAAAAALASSSSSQNQPPPAVPGGQPPPATPMDSSRALGLWQSNFGAVKIERAQAAADAGAPSAAGDSLSGVWIYDRDGQEVIGYFTGPLSGTVLQFRWNEPGQPSDLVGTGYIVFAPDGSSFSGTWTTLAGDRSGDFRGWRPTGVAPASTPSPEAPVGAQPPPPPGQGGSNP